MKFGIAFKLSLLLATVRVQAAGLTGFFAYLASRSLLSKSAKTELLTSTHVLSGRIAASRGEISRNLLILACGADKGYNAKGSTRRYFRTGDAGQPRILPDATELGCRQRSGTRAH